MKARLQPLTVAFFFSTWSLFALLTLKSTQIHSYSLNQSFSNFFVLRPCYIMQIASMEKIELFLVTYRNAMRRSCQQRGSVIHLTPLTLFSSSFFELLTPQRPGFRSLPNQRFITTKLPKLSLWNLSREKITYLAFVRAKKFFKIYLIKYAKLQFSKVTSIFTFRH